MKKKNIKNKRNIKKKKHKRVKKEKKNLYDIHVSIDLKIKKKKKL